MRNPDVVEVVNKGEIYLKIVQGYLSVRPARFRLNNDEDTILKLKTQFTGNLKDGWDDGYLIETQSQICL